MTALIQGRLTPKYGLDTFPNFAGGPEGFGVGAGVILFNGGLVMLATSGVNAGFAVPASANPGIVLGYIDRGGVTLDNTLGVAGAVTVSPRQGEIQLNSGSGVDAITSANLFQLAYVIDDNTVGLTDGGGTRPVAGMIMAVSSGSSTSNVFPAGVWILVGTLPGIVGTAASNVSTASLAHAVRGVVTANVASLAAFTVAGNDGLTYAAGDRVLLAGQTTASQNGPYVVGVVTTGTAPLTRPTDWVTGATAPSGVNFVATSGTAWANSTWKYLGAAGTVDTTSIPLYPQNVRGTQALTAGAATVSNLSISPTAQASVLDTTAAAAVKGVLTPGAGNGSLALTGTTTDVLAYVITNW